MFRVIIERMGKEVASYERSVGNILQNYVVALLRA